MMVSLWSAATGMLAQEMNMDVISNNLANVDTTGYKKNRANGNGAGVFACGVAGL